MFNPATAAPNVTGDLVTKVLAVEIYFQLRAGKSPIYFTLSDFADSYSLELLYIAVSISLLFAWIIPVAMLLYWSVFGSISFFLNAVGSSIKIKGTPILPFLRWKSDINRVSTQIAEDYAKNNHDDVLLARIKAFEAQKLKQVEGEVIATMNLLLICVIVGLGYMGAPNFLMKVTSFADPLLNNYGYEFVCFLLAVQGFFGRLFNYHIFGSMGHLPGDFFSGSEERDKVVAWASEIAARNVPFMRKWIEEEFRKRNKK
jgi:hypothetical protein